MDPTYLKKEVLHTAFAIAVTVLVAVAASVAGAENFDRAFLMGLAVTAARSGATAIVTLGSRFVVK